MYQNTTHRHSFLSLTSIEKTEHSCCRIEVYATVVNLGHLLHSCNGHLYFHVRGLMVTKSFAHLMLVASLSHKNDSKSVFFFFRSLFIDLTKLLR